LENLKTLLLAGNALTALEVSFEENSAHSAEGRKVLLWFPNLTMLDLSENKLSELSPKIASLTQLSVLNLSGNKDLGELPPQLGLLSRIWNLNFQGCNLQEPLKSLVERKGSKTMDIVGYLKSKKIIATLN
jgi:Leucine-rich repeat (LRR) protein